jgi:Catalase
VLLEDFVLREKINHFDHERIPERIVHARGAAARGFFELTDSLEKFSKARVLNRVGEKTPVFVRFSTVARNAGSSDMARDVRGFVVKLYTKRGQLGSCRKQYTGLLHSRRNQVSGSHPCSKTGARSWISPSADRARHVLGFCFTHT